MNDAHRAQPPHPGLADALTHFCKATADSLRLQILRLLRNDALSVQEMTRILDIRQPALSHHLKVLATAGLVSTRRAGNLIFYRRGLLASDDPLQALKQSMFDTIDLLPLDADREMRLGDIKAERELQSLDFFNKFADKFRHSADLVADSQQYASCLRELLGGLRLPQHSVGLEVGPGEGKLLPLLSTACKQLLALDKSQASLDKARANVQAAGLDSVDFIHGDTADARRLGLNADLVVISMVLHHAEAPQAILDDLYALLKPGGSVLIVELCRHQQDWLRELRGDLWLGFEPEELSTWAQDTGFTLGQHLFLGLKNGFQVQMRLFHRPASPPES